MAQKKDIKLIKKLLSDKKKRKHYSQPELSYMSLQLMALNAQRKRKKLKEKQSKGFQNESSETNFS